jgi:epoxide hydrolase 4
MDLKYQYHEVNGVKLHVGHAGKEHKKILLFLHGFPEFSYGWKNQVPFFVEKGFHVVVPDQRGYNLSSKPRGKSAYKLEVLIMDIALLIKSLTTDKIILVGHDWGGAVSWSLSMYHPELIDKMVILNMPHPQVMKDTLKSDMRQKLSSWYVGFFQVPWLPEFLSSRFNFSMLESSMRKTSNPSTFSVVDMAHYKKAWGQRKALKSMIHWYRAFRESDLQVDIKVTVQTLILWGAKDRFLVQDMAGKSLAKCQEGQLNLLQDLTHWLHHEDPERINNLMLEFIVKKS